MPFVVCTAGVALGSWKTPNPPRYWHRFGRKPRFRSIPVSPAYVLTFVAIPTTRGSVECLFPAASLHRRRPDSGPRGAGGAVRDVSLPTSGRSSAAPVYREIGAGVSLSTTLYRGTATAVVACALLPTCRRWFRSRRTVTRRRGKQRTLVAVRKMCNGAGADTRRPSVDSRLRYDGGPREKPLVVKKKKRFARRIGGIPRFRHCVRRVSENHRYSRCSTSKLHDVVHRFLLPPRRIAFRCVFTVYSSTAPPPPPHRRFLYTSISFSRLFSGRNSPPPPPPLTVTSSDAHVGTVYSYPE